MGCGGGQGKGHLIADTTKIKNDANNGSQWEPMATTTDASPSYLTITLLSITGAENPQAKQTPHNVVTHLTVY